MTSGIFKRRVADEVGIDVSDRMIRHAIDIGDLSNVEKRGGWYVFDEGHIPAMVDYLRRHSRKLLLAESQRTEASS